MGCDRRCCQFCGGLVVTPPPRFLLPSPKARLDSLVCTPKVGHHAAARQRLSRAGAVRFPCPQAQSPRQAPSSRVRRPSVALGGGAGTWTATGEYSARPRAPHDDDGGGGSAPRVGAYADAAHSEIKSTALIRQSQDRNGHLLGSRRVQRPEAALWCVWFGCELWKSCCGKSAVRKLL
jgi:hypothetical protein